MQMLQSELEVDSVLARHGAEHTGIIPGPSLQDVYNLVVIPDSLFLKQQVLQISAGGKGVAPECGSE